MSKKTDRDRRQRLFQRGNTQCPICLTSFTRALVRSGNKVTLEHAPPKTLGGRVACLTCADCNNSASRFDRLAKMVEEAKDDHLSGRGTRVEMDFFGGGIVSGYVRPKDEEMAARFAKQPVPTSINQLRGGVMQLPALPLGPELDYSKGIRFRIRQPNPHSVAVSWLRSAYLLLFSLLGREGYRYAKSGALGPIREQIMNPSRIVIKGCLNGSISGLDFPVDPVIMMNYGHKPPFWAVKMGDRCVFLPCGGSLERFQGLTQKPIDMSVAGDRTAFWSSPQFGLAPTLGGPLPIDNNTYGSTDFVGAILDVEMNEGHIWEWIIVDYMTNEITALPLRQKTDEQEGVGVMMMLGTDEYLRRKDRQAFVAASPKKLLSLTIDVKDDVSCDGHSS